MLSRRSSSQSELDHISYCLYAYPLCIVDGSDIYNAQLHSAFPRLAVDLVTETTKEGVILYLTIISIYNAVERCIRWGSSIDKGMLVHGYSRNRSSKGRDEH
jgi:hypothetical protein